MSIQSERISNGYLELAIHELEHRDTAATVSIVGLSHVALPDFYHRTNDYIEMRENSGSIVHIESLYFPEEDMLDIWPKWAIRLALRFNEARSVINGLRDRDMQDGRISQFSKAGLLDREEWEIHDIHVVEMIRRLGRLNATYVVKSLERLNTFLDENREEPRIMDIVMISAGMRLADGVLVKYRNDVAVTAAEIALRDNPDQALTLLWGSSHLPGIAKGLLSNRNGLVYARTKWQKAYRVPAHYQL